MHGPSPGFERLSREVCMPSPALDASMQISCHHLGKETQIIPRRQEETFRTSLYRALPMLLATSMIHLWGGLKGCNVGYGGQLTTAFSAMQLHVEVYCEETARHTVWLTVLSQLWSFNWHQEDFPVDDMEVLPAFLFSDKCPAHVRLCLGHICEPTAPLVSSPLSPIAGY